MTRSQQSINLTLLYAAFYESVFLSFGIIPLCLMILAYDKINSTMNKTVTQHCLSDLPQIRVQVTHAIANTESIVNAHARQSALRFVLLFVIVLLCVINQKLSNAVQGCP